MTNRLSTFSVLILAVALAAPAFAQAIPEDVAKASADLAARQAEAVARAQQKVADELNRAAEAKAIALTPLDVEITISRYMGDKRISALPYSISVNAAERPERTSLRMGSSVPIPNMAPPMADGKPVPGAITSGPVTYRDIGTNIDCTARPLGDGRFSLNLVVGETSVAPNTGQGGSGTLAGPVVLRNFSTTNLLVLRDGQTRQFTAAADRVSGEVVKVEVTLRVVK